MKNRSALLPPHRVIVSADMRSVGHISPAAYLMAVERHWFRRLRPRLQPWIEITALPDGGAEFYDVIMATHLHLNPTAHIIVERMRAGNQRLADIAVDLANEFGRDEQQLLTDVIQIYQTLESKEATVHPVWRFWVLWAQYIKHTYVVAFYQYFTRGLRMLSGG
ncbi:hypothetical protein TFLX_05688 [Thermoflexales bacterium]|nr:hypothetical protein TFLX_05688 [Thermoflexales bacterium]